VTSADAGRVALVTGAGRGIGKATALLLAERGFRVMATARSKDELSQLGLDYAIGDVAVAGDCERVVAETRERLGPISVLVNNAGFGSAAEREIWQQDVAAWRRTLAVNLDGPFYLCRAAVGGMVEQGYGRCVFVSSTAGVVADVAMTAYCASKAGLLGLMRGVAQDAGRHGVTSNAVLPGWVRTEMAEVSAREEAERRGVDAEDIWRERASSYPLGRVVTPKEVAETIAFLCSEESSGINGEQITVALGSTW
jgi:NAD(P)-dependent dehydrogenase (short-subunit alcohol dehydrogenase family)